MKFTKPRLDEKFTITVVPEWPSIVFETDEKGSHVWNWTIEWGQFKKTGRETTASNTWDAKGVVTNHGGKLTVRAEANKLSASITVRIVGTNPTQMDVKQYLATKLNSSGFDKLVEHEAKFKHFNAQNEPIKSFDNGYGMCQLTAPAPSFEQIWNWKRNVDGGLSLFEKKRLSAVTYLSQSQRTYTSEQLKYETVCRWNGGSYHAWDTTTNAWVRRPNILCDSKTGNIGWDMDDEDNNCKTEADLRKRDSGTYSSPPKDDAHWNYFGVCYFTLLLSALACAAPQANDAVVPPSAGIRSALEFRLSSGKHYTVPVVRDASVLQNTKPRKITIVGEVKDIAVVLVDTYPSIPGGMSYCQAGEERFLRIISLVKKNPVETFHVKLESCRDNIELATPGIDWSAESSKLVIHWLQGPATPGKPETRTLVIDAAGKLR